MYQIIAAAVGAIIGGVTQGVTTAVNTNKKVDALRKSAEKAYNLADEYSGANLNRKMTEAGQRNAQELSRESLANQLNNYQPTTGNAMANVNNRQQFNSNYADFYNQGANREAQLANAEYNKGTADIERNLKQADIDYNVANQTSQAVMNGIGNAAGTIGDMGGYKNNTAASDENCKEPINNDSGLPRADIQDSLRQLESVKYKYTDEAQNNVPGTDNEEHVGTVTQSMEQTPLFKDAVIHDENGIGKVDLFRLNEAIEAGLAEMQREIDELSNTATSDERCKQAENAIESNPVEAAQSLPQGSDIQKEAVQAIDDDYIQVSDRRLKRSTIPAKRRIING